MIVVVAYATNALAPRHQPLLLVSPRTYVCTYARIPQLDSTLFYHGEKDIYPRPSRSSSSQRRRRRRRRRCIDADCAANFFPFAERFECVTHTLSLSLSVCLCFSIHSQSRRKKKRKKRKKRRKKNMGEEEREREKRRRKEERKEESRMCVTRDTIERNSGSFQKRVRSNVYRRNICSEKRREAYEHR